MSEVPLSDTADEPHDATAEWPLWKPRVQLTMSVIAGALLLAGFHTGFKPQVKIF